MKYEDIINFMNVKREYFEVKDFELVERIFKEAFEKENNKLANIKGLGDLEFRKGNYKKAIDLYTDYLELNKENHIVYSNRAAAYHKLNMIEEAIEDCKKGLEICPTFGKLYLRLGLLLKPTDATESFEYFKKGLEVDEKNEVLIKQLESVKGELQAESTN